MNTPNRTPFSVFLFMFLLGTVLGTLQYLYDSEMVFHEATSSVTIINAMSFSAYLCLYGLVPAVLASGLVLAVSRNQGLSMPQKSTNSRQS
jgi:hypothetical protein